MKSLIDIFYNNAVKNIDVSTEGLGVHLLYPHEI